MSNDILTDEVQRHKNMLLAMASMNMNREALLALCQFAEIPMTTDQIKYLRGPVITAKSPWATDMHRTSLSWMFDGVAHARLERIFSEKPGQQALASTLEVAIVMQPYVYEAPMRSEWANVFLWTASQASLAYQKSSLSMEERVIKFDELGVKPLTRYEEQEHYNHIAADIRRKVVSHALKSKPIKPKSMLVKVEDIPRADESDEEYEARMNGSAAFDPSYLEQIFAQMESRVKEKEETAAFDASYIEQIFAQMETRKGRV